MSAEEILYNINNIIISENGLPVTMGSLFMHSGLDSLGVMMVLLEIQSEYNIPVEPIEELDIPTLLIPDLVKLCELSIIST